MRPPIFAYTAIGSSPDPVPRNVQSLTACVRRFRLCQRASHSLVNWHVRFRNRRPSVQGTARPPRFVYTASGTCTCEGTGNVQSRTAGVQRRHLRQSVFYGLVNLRVRFRNHTPSIQGATGPHTFVYTASGASTGTGLGAVRTAGIRKCHFGQSASHSMVNWH